MIAVVCMRWNPTTRAYVERRTLDDLSKREIIRCLKRYIARQAYHAITADLANQQAAETPPNPVDDGRRRYRLGPDHPVELRSDGRIPALSGRLTADT
jgi:hypothetical protein